MGNAHPIGGPTTNSGGRCTHIVRYKGFSLSELMVTLGVVTALCLGAATSLIFANRTGTMDRSRTSARALCQDRIEQVLSQPYTPPNKLPAVFGTWPIPGTDTVSSTDPVDVYVDDAGNKVINGTRTVTVSRPNATLNYVLVTARVDYTYRGRSYQQEISTVRAPD